MAGRIRMMRTRSDGVFSEEALVRRWLNVVSKWTRTRDQTADDRAVADVNALRRTYAALSVDELRRVSGRAASVTEIVAVTAVVASQVLRLDMFDEQILGALRLAQGRVVEMATGEGKTLAAVPAIAWYARTGDGVHVLTANDYLASRDAAWMGDIYRRLGLSVSQVTQDSSPAERRAAYAADVTYTTAHEVGFDYLRDGLALSAADQVLRPFASAVVDEADSLLLDDARIPMVIAGGAVAESDLAERVDRIIRELSPGRHYATEREWRNVTLTPAGIAYVERALGCANLFDPAALTTHAAVQDGLHAHVLLRRDVDYVVSGDRVLTVDEFRGRIVRERRWPAGLQAALEAKERVSARSQGRVLGSITVEHLVALYPRVCGMTGTAATQADEFRDIYGLDVAVIPTHRPIVRRDALDAVFATVGEKESAIRREVRVLHATGRPVLIGTASVEESERLSRSLADVPHHVLNARHEAAEAAIIAAAGQRDAVTISTNMAGRGVDIALGSGVAELGGLAVIGTSRHESRRIDHQLRGRAGRQGDPGSSQFFVSLEDSLMLKYGDAADPEASPDHCQRVAEGRNLDIRLFLRRYESIVEAQRLKIAAMRQSILTGETPTDDPAAQRVWVTVIDDLWADYLAAVAEVRAGTAWVSLGYGNPFQHYLQQVHAMFAEFEASIGAEVEARLSRGGEGIDEPTGRGATWTYLTTDEPFGRMTARVLRAFVQSARRRRRRS
jgi:preprotein translocase subunit SecA